MVEIHLHPNSQRERKAILKKSDKSIEMNLFFLFQTSPLEYGLRYLPFLFGATIFINVFSIFYSSKNGIFFNFLFLTRDIYNNIYTCRYVHAYTCIYILENILICIYLQTQRKFFERLVKTSCISTENFIKGLHKTQLDIEPPVSFVFPYSY